MKIRSLLHQANIRRRILAPNNTNYSYLRCTTVTAKIPKGQESINSCMQQYKLHLLIELQKC